MRRQETGNGLLFIYISYFVPGKYAIIINTVCGGNNDEIYHGS